MVPVLNHCLLLLLITLQGPALVGQDAQSSTSKLTDRQERVLTGVARGRYVGRWQELTDDQFAVMQRRADDYRSRLVDRHLRDGLVVSLRADGVTPGGVSSYEALDLSATQTGYLLSVEALRFAMTRDAGSTVGISNLLSGVERLLSSGPRPGFLPVFVCAAADPAYRVVYSKHGGEDPDRPGFGRLAREGMSTNGVPVIWLGGADREAYAALNMGLGLVHKLVREPVIRDRVARSVGLMLERLREDGWRIQDGFGRTNFVTPLLKTALLCTGANTEPRIYLVPFRAMAAGLLELPSPSMTRYGWYAGNVSVFANLFLLARLDPESSRVELYRRRLTQIWDEAEPDLNPLLAALYMDAFERRPNNSGAITILQGVLAQFPDPPRVPISTSATNDPPAKLMANGREWARHAQLLDRRPVAPFQWFESPYQLGSGKGSDRTFVEHPGVDYLLAYWLAKDAGLLTSVSSTEDSGAPSKDAGSRPQQKPASRSTGGSGRTNAPAKGVGAER